MSTLKYTEKPGLMRNHTFFAQPPPRSIQAPTGEFGALFYRERATTRRKCTGMGAVLVGMTTLFGLGIGFGTEAPWVGAGVGAAIGAGVFGPPLVLYARWFWNLRRALFEHGIAHVGTITSAEAVVMRGMRGGATPGRLVAVRYGDAAAPATCTFRVADRVVERDGLNVSPGSEVLILTSQGQVKQRVVVVDLHIYAA